jgi:hypothetical protein
MHSPVSPLRLCASLTALSEFAYTGAIPVDDAQDVTEDLVEAQTKLDDLLELLTLCDVWDMRGLRSVVTKAIVEDYELVRPENVLASKFRCLNYYGLADLFLVSQSRSALRWHMLTI